MKQQNWEFSEGADRLQGNMASGWSFPTFSIVEKLKTHLRISSLREQDRRVKVSAKTDGDPGTHMVAAKNQFPRINLSISTRNKQVNRGDKGILPLPGKQGESFG